jgi:hypothetical protein
MRDSVQASDGRGTFKAPGDVKLLCYSVAFGLFSAAGAAMLIGFRDAGYGFVFLGGLVVLIIHGLERLSDRKNGSNPGKAD